jgi:hypothetical protein
VHGGEEKRWSWVEKRKKKKKRDVGVFSEEEKEEEVHLLWINDYGLLIKFFLPIVLPMNNQILIFLIIPSVIPLIIFNLKFQFNQKFSETPKYHRWLFSLSMILSVIFNLNFQKTPQISSTTFQSFSDCVCKE